MRIVAVIFFLLSANASFAQDQQIIVDTNGNLKVQNTQNSQTQMPIPPMKPSNMQQPIPSNAQGLPMPGQPSNQGQTIPQPSPGQPMPNPANTQLPGATQPLPPSQTSTNPIYPGGVTNPGGPR